MNKSIFYQSNNLSKTNNNSYHYKVCFILSFLSLIFILVINIIAIFKEIIKISEKI